MCTSKAADALQSLLAESRLDEGKKINSLLRQYLYVCTSRAADAQGVLAERRLAAASAAVFVLLYE